MAHANVALDVEGWRAREPEGLHVSEHLRLEEATLGPGAAKPADQFVVDRTSVLIDQLDPLVAAVVRVAVIHDDVETVCNVEKQRRRKSGCRAAGRVVSINNVRARTVFAGEIDRNGVRRDETLLIMRPINQVRRANERTNEQTTRGV